MKTNKTLSFYRNSSALMLALFLLLPVIIQGQNSSTAGKAIIKISSAEALLIAQKYYQTAFPKIESDLKDDFFRTVNFTPSFDGKNRDSLASLSYSIKTAGMISFTDAKNFYLALAAATFSLDCSSSNAALNLGSAIACYNDDIILSSGNKSSAGNSFYQDALKMYSYAILCSSTLPEISRRSIPAINCLANLYLDLNQPESAYALFSEANKISPEDHTAIMGLYNYYIMKKQFDKALKLIMENSKSAPVFARSVSRLSAKIPNEMNEGNQGTEEAAEKEIIISSAIPAATSADFIEELDPAAAKQIRKDIETVQDKMRIKAPNINYLLMIKNYENMSREFGLSALTAIGNQMSELGIGTVGYETEALVEKNIAALKNLGVDVEANFDTENIQKLINDALKNPDKYENFKPDVKISGLNGIADKAKQNQKKLNKAASKGVRGDSRELFEQLSKTNPEFSIMSVNPYNYVNSNDIIIQRFNVLALSKKLSAYKSYLAGANSKASEIITDLMGLYTSKLFPLLNEYQQKLIAIINAGGDPDKQKLKIHRLHTTYFPRFNNIGAPFWNQATEAASVAYKKLEKYTGAMYKECMKHIMLISDFEIREKLEKDLNSFLLITIRTGMQNAVTAFTFALHYDAELCDCDLDEIREIKERIEQETEKLANEQIIKNMADKKNFEQGVLDENSDYYKNFIAKYEYEINLVFVKEKVSAYKSSFEAGLDLAMFGINYTSVTNHLRNTTTYDGNISFGGEVAGGSLKSIFGLSAVKGSNGTFSPKDIDIRAAVEGGISTGVLSLTGGVSASAMRGTNVYANAGVTADKYLDDFKKKEKLEWLPGIGKEVWSGNYRND